MAHVADMVKMIISLASFVVDEENDSLVAEVSLEKFKEALSSLQGDKIPCSDGWHVEFYKFFLELFELDLLRVIEESRANGKIIDAFNSTFISIIPRSNSHVSLD